MMMLRAFNTFKLLSPVVPNFGFASYRPAITPIEDWKLVRGDKVVMISGKDSGKTGQITRVYRKLNRVLIQGINVKLQRLDSQRDQQGGGGTRQISKSVHVSKVALIDPVSSKPTKVSIAFTETGDKVRVSKRSGSIIEKKKYEGYIREKRHKNKVDGLLDTAPKDATEVTYKGEDFAAIREEFYARMRKKEEAEKKLIFDS